MRNAIAIFALFVILVPASHCLAQPRKGFHTGPYLALEGGVMQTDFDRDEVTGTEYGRDFDPAIGLLFGWNVYDWLSAELQGRYATSAAAGNREHFASGALFAKYTFILDALTGFDTFRALPFVKCGIVGKVSALPGNPGSSHGTVTSWGMGPSPGIGIAFIWQKYFYFGIDLQEDLLFFNEIDQTVNGVPNTLVYKGGFHPSFGAMAILGVHY